jgi:hypothetical protein
MESDFEGKIDLGRLNDVKNINLDRNSFEIQQLPKHTYMPVMTILENQEINLPFNGSNDTFISLLRIEGGQNCENLTKLLKITYTDKVNNLGNISLPKLSKGNYRLKIDDDIIEISVIKGEVMEIPDFIVTENGDIRYNNNVESFIAIENVTYQNKELKIKLNKNNKSSNYPRIHINCVQYLPKKLNKNLFTFQQGQFYQYRIRNEYQLFK